MFYLLIKNHKHCISSQISTLQDSKPKCNVSLLLLQTSGLAASSSEEDLSTSSTVDCDLNNGNLHICMHFVIVLRYLYDVVEESVLRSLML